MTVTRDRWTEGFFFRIFGFPVSQNMKKRVFKKKKSRFFDKLQNELLYKKATPMDGLVIWINVSGPRKSYPATH